MSREQEAMMRRVMEYAFAVNDTALFLDTHPDSKEAFYYMRQMQENAAQATKEYEARFGPLSINAAANADTWRWDNAPWPWEMEG